MEKRMRIGFGLALVFLVGAAFGKSAPKTYSAKIPASVSHWVTMSGNDLYQTCLAWEKTENDGGQGNADTVIKAQTCYAFILGVINAYPAVTSFPPGTTNEQIVDVAINYLREHPAERGKDAWHLILSAEEAAFHVKWLLL